MKIGIALSGGGYRATVFHLGVLARMAEDGLLEQIRFVSSVSGGSIATGLLFAANGNRWPTSSTYRNKVVPYAFEKLTTQNLQLWLLLDLLLVPINLVSSRARLVSKRLARQLGITGQLANLPSSPRWLINTTCLETGRSWRFEKIRMGGYLFGYVDHPDYLISDAVAASCGLPLAIGPMTVKSNQFEGWYDFDPDTNKKGPPRDPLSRKAHLYDGGVYGNIGLEPLVNYNGPNGGYALRSGIDYLMVSNASGKVDARPVSYGLDSLSRLISIPKYQVEALRSRDILHRIVYHDLAGRYFDTDNSCRRIFAHHDRSAAEVERMCAGYLTDEVVDQQARIGTHIKKLTAEDFELLFRLGFEVTDCTLHAFGADEYDLVGFDVARWEGIFRG